MIALEYRLHELHDRGQRRALIDDMLTHYAADPDLVAFLRAADAAIGATSEESQEDIKRMEDEAEYLQDEIYALEATVAELRADLEYWKERAADD